MSHAVSEEVRTPRRAPERTVPSLRAVRRGPVSLLVRPRQVVVVTAAVAVLVVLVAVSMGLGQFAISPLRVLEVLAGGGERAERMVVLDLRAPRTVVGILVGAALAASGAITQAVLRNPLASPDFLGLTAGASAAAVALIVLAGSGGVATGIAAVVGVPVAALAGGLLTGLTIYLLAWRDGVDGYRFVLVGVAVGSALLAVTSWLLVLAKVQEASRAMIWLTGSLNGRGWDESLLLAGALVVLLPVAVVLGARLGILQLGEDVARGLGVRVEVVRLTLLVVAVLLASLATAAAGPVAFVALVSPQVARLMTRSPRPPLLASALVGSCLVTASDVVARELLPVTLPVGVVTAAVGAPYLLWLIARSSRKAAA